MVNLNITALAAAASTFSIMDFQNRAVYDSNKITLNNNPVIANANAASQWTAVTSSAVELHPSPETEPNSLRLSLLRGRERMEVPRTRRRSRTPSVWSRGQGSLAPKNPGERGFEAAGRVVAASARTRSDVEAPRCYGRVLRSRRVPSTSDAGWAAEGAEVRVEVLVERIHPETQTQSQMIRRFQTLWYSWCRIRYIRTSTGMEGVKSVGTAQSESNSRSCIETNKKPARISIYSVNEA
ncbi:hypothetical protein C8R45DRAFT_1075207 [Mycena sanguinolenta]|nr:hypothetical protein C8R45DRAFT_1075207 [Mycena sanguinolenta]